MKSLVQQVQVGDVEISVRLNRTAVVSSVMPDATPRHTECKTAVEPAACRSSLHFAGPERELGS